MTDIQETLAERGARYGDFTDHAALSQKLQDVMRDSGAVHVAGETFMSTNKGWNALSPAKRQALSVIADKIARILSGDPEYRDNWHDIAGYATLAHDRCVDTDGPQMPLADPVEEDDWIGWADRYQHDSTDMPSHPRGAGNRPIEIETNAGARTRGRGDEFDWSRIFGPYAIARWRFEK